MADVVFSAIRNAISEGRLTPGDWLRQEALAEELGVSQNPVREALTRLVAEGLAVRFPHKGVRVAALPMVDIVDIYTMRALLEGWAAELAATRLTPAQLSRLHELAMQVEDRFAVDPKVARELYREFHEIIAQASGRRYLARVIGQLRSWADPSLVLTREERALQEHFHRGARSHLQIFAALEARDGTTARQIMTEHIMIPCQNLQEIYASELAQQTSSEEEGDEGIPTP